MSIWVQSSVMGAVSLAQGPLPREREIQSPAHMQRGRAHRRRGAAEPRCRQILSAAASVLIYSSLLSVVFFFSHLMGLYLD